MFEKGNTYGNHSNHWRGGRLTKEEFAKLKELVPLALQAQREILEEKSQKYSHVRAQVAKDVMAKFVADLTELSAKLEMNGAQEIADGLRDIAGRIAGKDKPVDTGTAAGNETGDIQRTP